MRAPYDDASDFIYTLDKDGNNAKVKSKKLLAMNQGCDFGDDGFIGYLYRALPSDPAPSEVEDSTTVEQRAKEYPDGFKKIGDYYYYVIGPQQTCFAANTKNVEEISKVAEQKSNDLKAIVKKLEATK